MMVTELTKHNIIYIQFAFIYKKKNKKFKKIN